jgi:hypothetical protein
MTDRKTTESHGLALVPLRNGKLLTNNNESRVHAGGTSRASIPLWHRKETATNPNPNSNPNPIIVIGRPELLSCLYAACGCDSKIYSTKHKCGQCQEVSEWAVRALSRQMLCVVSENHVAVRGAHAIVVCDSEVVCGGGGVGGGAHHYEDDSKHNINNNNNRYDDSAGLCWRGRQRIQAGSKLEFREAEGDGLVEFQVVLMNIKTRKIIQSEKMLVCAKNEAHYTSNSMPKSVCLNSHLSSRQGELVQCPRAGLLLLDGPRKKDFSNLCQSNKKPSINTSHQQAQFRIYFVPLGQDLSRQRITLLSDFAAKRGAQVITDDFRFATQLIVSEQVATLERVANKLGITQEDLKCHLDQVSVMSFGLVWFASYPIYGLLRV